jgi:hypothetical protein
MIYLEKPNILFLKPLKVAGTSFEIALSKFAGPNDILTELRRDEPLRAKRGYQEPTNFRWPLSEIVKMRRNDILKLLYYKRNRRKFVQHTSAGQARERLGNDRFDGAFKVSIVRNPFDQLISLYFYYIFKGAAKQPSLETWIYENPWVLTTNEQFYTIGHDEIIDFYIRYEKFAEDIAQLEQQKPVLLGLGDAFKDTNAKSGIRPKDRSTDEYFERKNALINTVLFFQGHHIERFGYPIPPQR